MISNELLETLQKLNRVDKLRVIQLLAEDLAADEAAFLTSGATYEVWSPYDASSAAESLLNLLDEDREKHD